MTTLNLVFLGVTGFYLVLLDLTGLYLVKLGSYTSEPSFTGFYLVLPGFFVGFTEFYRVSPVYLFIYLFLVERRGKGDGVGAAVRRYVT